MRSKRQGQAQGREIHSCGLPMLGVNEPHWDNIKFCECPENTPTKTPLSLDEFDLESAKEGALRWAASLTREFEPQSLVRDWVEGARFQHEKLRPVIQFLEQQNKVRGESLLAATAEIQELRAERNEWEARYNGLVMLERKPSYKELETEIQALKAENERLKSDLKMAIEIGVEGQREINRRQWDEHQKCEPMIKELTKALEYYSHPDHYTESQTLGGIRQPGVLTEGGKLAREVLNKQRGKNE